MKTVKVQLVEGDDKALHAALMDGCKVLIPELGAFVLKEQKARTGRNPKTGEAIQIPAKRVVKFKVTKSLKDAVA